MVHKALLFLALLIFSSPAGSEPLAPLMVRIAREERIPPKLLQTLVKLESAGHPWTLNVRGKPYFFKSQQEAATFLAQTLSRGIQNIDIGLCQINAFWHGKAVSHPSRFLDPATNLRYAARLLRHHSVSSGSWMKGALLYHSSVGVHQSIYKKKLRHLLITGKSA